MRLSNEANRRDLDKQRSGTNASRDPVLGKLLLKLHSRQRAGSRQRRGLPDDGGWRHQIDFEARDTFNDEPE